jgi:hypothetical protein
LSCVYFTRATCPRHVAWIVAANKCLEARNRFSMSNTVRGCFINTFVLKTQQRVSDSYASFRIHILLLLRSINKSAREIRVYG